MRNAPHQWVLEDIVEHDSHAFEFPAVRADIILAMQGSHTKDIDNDFVLLELPSACQAGIVDVHARW